MTTWLTKELKDKIRKQFEPRYKKKLSEEEVDLIAENLTGYMEVILKFKARMSKQKSQCYSSSSETKG